MSTLSEKERNKLIQEKCQSILSDLLKDEDNKYCVDCDAKSRELQCVGREGDQLVLGAVL